MTCEIPCLPTKTHPIKIPSAPRPARRRNRAGAFIRSATTRIAVEQLLHRSKFLPETPRTILRAYLELKMPVKELALLHKIPPRVLARRIRRWKEMLADPEFLLAARFGPQLPAPRAALAAAYWSDGRSLRYLAASAGVTLHQIRSQLADTRLQLVKIAAAEALQS